MSKKIGIIAEDNSDILVITKIFEKYMDSSSFSIRKFVGNGCGKLRNKCGAWAKMLTNSGCEHILVFHDLDRNSERDLREDISNKINNQMFPNSIIVIPVEELESWLLSDVSAIRDVFKLEKAPSEISDCEIIKSPKEYLRDLVWKIGKKRYLNTTHNCKIANKVSIANLLRCKSYRPLDKYITENICAE